ncbi:uncharacterized protein UMAG_00478 [Mycosarcoma maydis]|uniref:F-box domain-containing protein n=1 Tax=Mycosarcoma maydis TaxID=5270 RepID=A0A0D1E9U4_MYCMD|nr:uncharacterized protein UMAG_00478 [Ustilago maydis 521]KIS72056.1 hypothetical protein UMAG_00478 [Ustilago maydis 521]|eukprot:XP_011386336.1 hypothetical protein UMAG_00478 [Ustilago maydis 521]
MTSLPSQPSVADAARLMDSLSIASESTSSLLIASATDHDVPLQPRAGAKTGEFDQHQATSYDSHRVQPTLTRSVTGCSAAKQFSATSNLKGLPSLPAEIIFQIATHYLSTMSTPLHTSTDVRPTGFGCKHAFPPYASLISTGSELSALMSLSSVTRSFRNTLVPLIWHTIVIRTPQHLPRLATLLKSYDTLSIRSGSPPQPRSSLHTREPKDDFHDARLRHPLPHIRSIVIAVPDKYMDLDQSYLLTLLRSMHLSQTQQLEHLAWSAEAVPNPAIWALLGPSLRSLELDGRTFYHGHAAMSGLERLESLTMVGYESTLLPRGVVAVFQAQARADGIEASAGEIHELPEGAEEEGKRGSGESPVVELQATAAEERRQARHLYLDPPSTTWSPPAPPPFPRLPISPSTTRTRLAHLSLSTSKTSLFHQPSLLPSFRGLTHLDIFPITPQPPLSRSLISTASTLTHLRIVLDISGAFANYDALWSDLTGNLPLLEWLDVDPLPQQNTAPSFARFVDAAKNLKYINGRDVHSLALCFGDLDPSNPSAPLPY